MSPHKICVVTGSRAEFGLLAPLMSRIATCPEAFVLQLAVTGAHVSKRHGETKHFIIREGFSIDAEVDLGLDDCRTAADTARAAGLGVSGFASAYERLSPDLVVIYGDRYEILAAATAAVLMGIPLSHVAGGDLTEGAFDDSIRHSLTKLAHLHFPTHAAAARRIRQLGEESHRIVIAGSLGVDVIRNTPLLSRADIESRLGFQLRRHNLLITFHPVTLGATSGECQFKELLSALGSLDTDVGLIFTAPNADPGEALIRAHLDAFVDNRPNACLHESLGQQLYLSTMACCDAVVGNSSSGIYEAPALKKPTVNIGDRQSGRERAASVIDCDARADAISLAIHKVFQLDCSAVTSPYGEGNAAERIVSHLTSISDFRSLLRKRFVDFEFLREKELSDD